MGRKTRHHSNDGQTERNTGAEGAHTWMCPKSTDLEQPLRELFAGEDGNCPSSAKGFSLLSPPVHARISPVTLV